MFLEKLEDEKVKKMSEKYLTKVLKEKEGRVHEMLEEGTFYRMEDRDYVNMIFKREEFDEQSISLTDFFVMVTCVEDPAEEAMINNMHRKIMYRSFGRDYLVALETILTNVMNQDSATVKTSINETSATIDDNELQALEI